MDNGLFKPSAPPAIFIYFRAESRTLAEDQAHNAQETDDGAGSSHGFSVAGLPDLGSPPRESHALGVQV
jgi:hypothetical protein